MPSGYSRIEVHLPPELSKRLALLKQELYEESGRKVPRNTIVVEILRQFLEDPNRSCFSTKK